MKINKILLTAALPAILLSPAAFHSSPVKAKAGMIFGVDVHISDSDKDFVQEAMTSLNNTVPWKGRRQENILKMVLTGTDGKIK